VDGIIRGIPKGVSSGGGLAVAGSATKISKGEFGAGIYPEGR